MTQTRLFKAFLIRQNKEEGKCRSFVLGICSIWDSTFIKNKTIIIYCVVILFGTIPFNCSTLLNVNDILYNAPISQEKIFFVLFRISQPLFIFVLTCFVFSSFSTSGEHRVPR